MILEVSELNEQAKAILEINFAEVSVKGEISRLIKHSSGHWYFALKDARSVINCAMFRGANASVKFNPTDGQKVVLSGKVSLYSPSGAYQFIASKMALEGVGDLDALFKALYQKLENEGLFDKNIKKALPNYPQKVAIITSSTSAAWADIQNRIAMSGYFLTKFYLFNSLMQGENAAQSAINALRYADDMGFDAIIIARGGGSKEDLWCFNDEGLAREIYKAKTPIISAIGHEIDYSICDFVADHRSITPTASIDDLLPNRDELEQGLDYYQLEIEKAIKNKIVNLQNLIHTKALEYKANSVYQMLNENEKNLQIAMDKIKFAMKSKFLSKQDDFKTLRQNFINNQPLDKIKNLENLLDMKLINFQSAIKTKLQNLEHLIELKKTNFDNKKEFFEISKNLVSVEQNGKRVDLSSLKVGDEIIISSQNAQKTAQIKD